MTDQESLTAAAARGALWTFLSIGFAIVLTLVTQIVLGWLLSDQDFGVFALAAGCANLVRVFRDGGVQLWLIRQSKEEFTENAGPAGWLVLLCSFSVAVVLWAIAPLLAAIYDSRQMSTLIWVIACALPLGAYPVVAIAQLHVELRFKTIAKITIGASIIGCTFRIALAALGLGPFSLVLPVLAVNLFLATAGYWATRLAIWRTPLLFKDCTRLLQRTIWPLSGAVAMAFFISVGYVALGLVASTATVGTYFFAHQSINHFIRLFTQSLRKVLIPLIARTVGQPQRQARVLKRSGIMLGAFVCPLFLTLCLTAESLEAILWQGRWANAVRPLQILSVVAPVEVAVRFVRIVSQSLGGFKELTVAITLRAVGLAIAALCAGLATPQDNVVTITGIIGAYLGASAIVEMVFLMKRAHLPIWPFFGGYLPLYAYGALAASATYYLTGYLGDAPVGFRVMLVCLVYGALIVIGHLTLFRSVLGEVVSIMENLRKDRRAAQG